MSTVPNIYIFNIQKHVKHPAPLHQNLKKLADEAIYDDVKLEVKLVATI